MIKALFRYITLVGFVTFLVACFNFFLVGVGAYIFFRNGDFSFAEASTKISCERTVFCGIYTSKVFRGNHQLR